MKVLSVVCIGKNEAANIARLAESLRILRLEGSIETETIYVDSASTDQSIDKAKFFFDVVLALESSPFLCASAGRYAGTQAATGDWVLYLDADMEICTSFLPVIQSVLLNEQGVERVGFLGDYLHVYPDGTTQKMGFAEAPGPAEAIGGAVLLHRQAVLAAGNWNPFIFSMEEMELYSRLGNGIKVIQYVSVDMIRHHTERFRKIDLLKSSLLPSGGLGKKFYGMGQIIHYRLMSRSIFSLIKLLPEAFAYVAVTVLVILSCLAGLFHWASIAISLYLFWLILIRKKKLKSLLIYSSYIIQTLAGWSRLNAEFRPKIAMRWKAGI